MEKQYLPSGTIITRPKYDSYNRTIYYNYLDNRGNLHWSEREESISTKNTNNMWLFKEIQVVELKEMDLISNLEIW